jgi:hypothetical protein
MPTISNKQEALDRLEKRNATGLLCSQKVISHPGPSFVTSVKGSKKWAGSNSFRP